MNKYKKVKDYYEQGLWNIEMIKNAVVKNWITAEQFEEITGELYNV